MSIINIIILYVSVKYFLTLVIYIFQSIFIDFISFQFPIYELLCQKVSILPNGKLISL